MSENTIYGDPELSYLFDEDKKTSKRGSNKKNVSIELLEEYESIDYRIPKKGDFVVAKFSGKTNEEYLLSVDGFKDFIRVDNKGSEFKYFENLQTDDSIEVVITKIDNNDFLIKGSVSMIQEKIARDLISKFKKGDFVMGKILSMNPAGYEVEVRQGAVSLAGFMPNTLAGINKLYDPSSIVGQTMELSIESFSESEGTYIVSRRKYLQSLIPDETAKLETNKVYTGHVTGTTPFGIFVEFNECLTGLIHKVNVNGEWRNKLDQIKPGFEIDFYVKEILPKNKIILTQILRDSLWDTIQTDMVIDGRVRDVKPFGALVSLDEETVGLIPSSELKNKTDLKKGDNVKVKVLTTDKTNRKITLSIV